MSFLEESKMSEVQKIHEEQGTGEKQEPEAQTRIAKETTSQIGQPAERQDNFDSNLDEIEKNIREVGDQLRELHTQSLKIGENDVQARLDYEDKRTGLRKRLIVLSQEHKDIIEKKHKKESEPVQKKEEEQPVEETKDKKPEDLEAELSKSRAQARVADIQLQLALTDLRISRRRALQAELSSLRLRYTYLPYLSYPYYRSIYTPYYRRWPWY